MIPAKAVFKIGGVVCGQVLVRETSVGLARVEGTKLIPLAGTGTFGPCPSPVSGFRPFPIPAA